MRRWCCSATLCANTPRVSVSQKPGHCGRSCSVRCAHGSTAKGRCRRCSICHSTAANALSLCAVCSAPLHLALLAPLPLPPLLKLPLPLSQPRLRSWAYFCCATIAWRKRIGSIEVSTARPVIGATAFRVTCESWEVRRQRAPWAL